MSYPGSKYGYKSNDGLVVDRGDGHFVETYNRICIESNERKQKWIISLKQEGIKAAHPDDGWHMREEGYFQFSYPYFNDGIQVGDKVALGDYKKFIILVVIKIGNSFFGMERYYYDKK